MLRSAPWARLEARTMFPRPYIGTLLLPPRQLIGETVFPMLPRPFRWESFMPDDARRPTFDKSTLPSRHVTVGPERAPHRSYLYAMGLTAEQIAQPLVGVVTTWNE